MIEYIRVIEYSSIPHIAETTIQAKDVRKQSIQAAIKSFAKCVFSDLDKSGFLTPHILGISVYTSLDTIDTNLVIGLYAEILSEAKRYHVTFVNRNLEIVNRQIYQQLSDIADLMTVLHEKTLQTVNLICVKEECICESHEYFVDMLEYFGVDMDVIWGYFSREIQTREHVQHAINTLDKCMEILTNFEAYRQLYEIEMLGKE